MRPLRLPTPAEVIHKLFAAAGPTPNLAPSWNVVPIQDAMVIRRHPDTGERRLDLLRWGLVPGWTKGLKAARKPINARSETAAASAMFKGALAMPVVLEPAVWPTWLSEDGGDAAGLMRSAADDVLHLCP